MGVDFYYCELCEECVNENYIYTGSDSDNEEYYEIFKRLNIKSVFSNICFHRLCIDCCPKEFLDIKNDKINNDNITIDVLNNPWNYCKLCLAEKNEKQKFADIKTKIANPEITKCQLIEIINDLIAGNCEIDD